MSQNTVCKIIRQYNKEPVSGKDMEKLLEIAEDYRKVKNYIYDRFGGIASLSKLYPGYTVQNEMTKSGLRGDLGIPSVYFYLAVFDALGDIKSQWSRTKSKILERIGKNEGFSKEEKHYLRFLLKVNSAFESAVNQNPIKLPGEIGETYEKLAAVVDREKLHRYLCRQVRKVHVKLHTDRAEGFSLAERAYRYGDNGIYHGIAVSTKEKRKRIFISLTDHNQYKCQIYMKLYPEKDKVEIHVPVNVAVKSYEDYRNCVGIAMGMYTMLTTNLGHGYGGDYINQELNRFLRTEKPQIIYMIKLPKPKAQGVNRKINYSVTVWQRGYIRKRLEQKCREQSVKLVEVLGKDISRQCSNCGEIGSGKQKDGIFVCGNCGYQAKEKTNTAQNVLRRGRDGQIVNESKAAKKEESHGL